jgi:hypothetical protein
LVGRHRHDVADGAVEVQDGVVAALQAGEDGRVDNTVTTFAREDPHVRASFGTRHRMDLDLDARTPFDGVEDECARVFAHVDDDGSTRHRRRLGLDVLVSIARAVVVGVIDVCLVVPVLVSVAVITVIVKT